ncbi:hypothetical protein ACIBO5_60700 [Nonomuraea angiospora]|uniref:hypothetical protein n=1 Tax=Nonomuraea angiospora TaxID=46172 RepID=UPI0029B2E0FB|nr:hypothetical protein [Nonomuraea angiospora]MDX3109368.1 hypothetical protein [Nonomuraea angiospora]
MNRVVKAAVAVTVFGLAAALAAPAQAEVGNNAVGNDGGGTNSPLDGLLGGGLLNDGLLSGLIGGGQLNGLLSGGLKPKAAAQPSRPMSSVERDIAAENQKRQGYTTTPNAAEDVTNFGGPLPELSPIVGGFSLGGGGLTESLPVPALSGAARMAQPVATSVKSGRQDGGQVLTEGETLRGAYDATTGLFNTSFSDAMDKLDNNSVLPGAGSSLLNTSAATAKTMSGTSKGIETLSAESIVAGLGKAARLALPQAASGRLSPAIGQVAPVEMAPVIEALPGTAQAASVDELTPLVEDTSGVVSANGTKATGTYGDVLTALGWTTDSLTSSVRDSWTRN